MSSRAEKQIRDTMWAAQQGFGLKKNHDRWLLVREIHRQARLQVATAVRGHVARARRQRLGQWFRGKEPQESWGSTPTPSQMIRKVQDSKVHAGTSCASLLWDCQLGTIRGRGCSECLSLGRQEVIIWEDLGINHYCSLNLWFIRW